MRQDLSESYFYLEGFGWTNRACYGHEKYLTNNDDTFHLFLLPQIDTYKIRV